MGKSFLFYITLFLLLFAFTLNAPQIDFDLWARLIAGMGVIEGGHVLKSDFLSYTPVHIWYDHEWGSGVIFYTFLKFLGQFGILILQIIIPFITFYIVTKVVKVRTGQQPQDILFFFFCVMAAMTNINNPIRCHLFSFMFFALFIYILEKVRNGTTPKILILLPILTVLWNNIHGGVVAGLGLIGMYIIGEIYNHSKFKYYIYTLLACTISLIINPWGIDYVNFLLHATTMERPLIGEWQGLFSQLQMPYQLTFKIFLLCVLAVGIWKIYDGIKKNSALEFYSKIDKVKIIVLLVTAYLAVEHIKMLPFFCISVACYCYPEFTKIFQKVNKKIVYVVILTVSIFSILTKNIELPINFMQYPITEVEFIKQNNIKGNILVDFGLGSYVAYKLYPNNKIYMDGRYEEVYPDELIVINDKFYASKADWDDVLKLYPPDIVLVQSNLPVFKLLQKRTDWKLIFKGNAFGVFIPASKYKGNYILPSLDRKYYKEKLFETSIKF